jgi:hypothetical protein
MRLHGIVANQTRGGDGATSTFASCRPGAAHAPRACASSRSHLGPRDRSVVSEWFAARSAAIQSSAARRLHRSTESWSRSGAASTSARITVVPIRTGSRTYRAPLSRNPWTSGSKATGPAPEHLDGEGKPRVAERDHGEGDRSPVAAPHQRRDHTGDDEQRAERERVPKCGPGVPRKRSPQEQPAAHAEREDHGYGDLGEPSVPLGARAARDERVLDDEACQTGTPRWRARWSSVAQRGHGRGHGGRSCPQAPVASVLAHVSMPGGASAGRCTP